MVKPQPTATAGSAGAPTDPVHDRVRREFARQHDSFAARNSFFGSHDIAEWIAGHLLLEPGDEVLDLAGGAGHLSRALASRARRFVVLDLTPEQLAVGRRATARENIANVEFMEGDASHAPFADASFDLVMSRFALHHMAHPAVTVREAGRVCRRGGRVALIDMVAPSDAATAARFNELERLRDPSHTSALSARAMEALIAAEGTIVSRDTRDHALPVDPWLEQAHTPATDRRTVVEALERELAGGPSTGMRPDREGGRLTVTQRWQLLVARR
jgi:ubiquinone/menaquinone biosynthesis C-methylase UbiE